MIWLLALQLGMGPQASYENASRAVDRMDFHRAEEQLDDALAKDPYFFPALKLKADLALFAQKPDIAKRCLVAAVVGNPSLADAHLSLGTFYETQGSFELAISPLEEAHSLSPRDPKPLLYLGMSYEGLAKAAEASAFYQQAEDLSPPNTVETAVILTAYGRLLSSFGKYRISVAKEQQAVRIDGTSRSAHYELAKALALAHSYKQAASEGELALKLPGSGISDVEIHLLLQDISLHLKSDDHARPIFGNHPVIRNSANE